jgi:hypothetical protein
MACNPGLYELGANIPVVCNKMVQEATQGAEKRAAVGTKQMAAGRIKVGWGWGGAPVRPRACHPQPDPHR